MEARIMLTEDKVKLAEDLFNQKMNCAQSVFAALTHGDIDQETAYSTAACFGGGMRTGEVCGAVTGALMALGYYHGAKEVGDTASKEKANALATMFLQDFKKSQGAIRCRDLLGYDLTISEDLEQIRREGLFDTACPRFIEEAVRIADRTLEDERS